MASSTTTSQTNYIPVPLFGGALTATLPTTFSDVSEIRQIPDHQEVFLEKTAFSSITFDILERVEGGRSDEEALKFHLFDLVEEDEGDVKVWTAGQARVAKLPTGTPAYTLLATAPAGAKQRDRAHEPEFVAILLLLIRLKEQATDLLVTINVPHIPGSGYEKGDVDFAGGKYGPLVQRAMEWRERVMWTFEVREWGLFGQEEEEEK